MKRILIGVVIIVVCRPALFLPADVHGGCYRGGDIHRDSIYRYACIDVPRPGWVDHRVKGRRLRGGFDLGKHNPVRGGIGPILRRVNSGLTCDFCIRVRREKLDVRGVRKIGFYRFRFIVYHMVITWQKMKHNIVLILCLPLRCFVLHSVRYNPIIGLYKQNLSVIACLHRNIADIKPLFGIAAEIVKVIARGPTF